MQNSVVKKGKLGHYLYLPRVARPGYRSLVGDVTLSV